MTEPIVIPKLQHGNSVWEDYPVVGEPGWFTVQEFGTGKTLKPLIRCNCGHVSGIGLHHVHPDGTVTASFYHKRGTHYPEDPDGCEWHVFLRLADWSGEDIPPDPK
jgi:hypothetical protein